MAHDKTKLTISEAARCVGVSRTTFYKHIKSKPITVGEDEDGKKYIDSSELVRAYNGKLKGNPDTIGENQNEQGEQGSVSSEHRNGQKFTPKNGQVEQVLRERIGDLEERVGDLKEDKQKLHSIIEKHQKTIEQQQTLLLPAPENEGKESTQKVGFIGRMFGKKPKPATTGG